MCHFCRDTLYIFISIFLNSGWGVKRVTAHLASSAHSPPPLRDPLPLFLSPKSHVFDPFSPSVSGCRGVGCRVSGVGGPKPVFKMFRWHRSCCQDISSSCCILLPALLACPRAYVLLMVGRVPLVAH